MTATCLATAVSSRGLRAADVCDAALAELTAINERTGAFLTVTEAYARERAAEIDAMLAAGRPAGPLAGVPLVLKDNLCTRFARTTCASRILDRYTSPYNATVVDRLEAAGAVVIGKANMDEFAMGSSSENSGYRPTRNPWKLDRVPGGSSGGSAVAVAARVVPVALGSDTGGSIRQPASMCGIVGLKPSYGRVSRYGLVAYGSSLDQIGPLATCVEDAALVLGVIAGHDPLDSTSVDQAVPDYLAELVDGRLAERRQALRIGIPREYFGDGLDDEVRRQIEAALEVYRRLGAELVEVSLPHTKHCVAAYYVVATAECSSNLARYDGVHYGHRTENPKDIFDLYSQSRDEGFGPEVKRRIMLGTFALSSGYYDAYYDKALRVRRLIKQDFDRALEQVDIIAGPAAPSPPFPIGEKVDDPLAMYLADIYTLSVNLAGVPGISIPCGFTQTGLPIGLQLIGPVFGETSLLQAARLFERETDWHTRVPPLAAAGGVGAGG
jgi:aspartyl-tRNA(Asn)/glutamyl-tRNA(Gln) amidotransferase subunit A